MIHCYLKVIRALALCLLLSAANLEAVNSIQDIVLLSNAEFDAIYFGTSLVSDKIQINEAIKPYGNPNWDPTTVISDPDVSVTSYSVRKDVDDNMVVGWIGENTVISAYSFYVRIYIAATDTWSAITIVSDPLQNLTGSFAVSINTKNVEAFWTSYNLIDYSIENHSLTISIE